MISLITRVQYPQLYSRMAESAKRLSSTAIEFVSEIDDVGQPLLCTSYNKLGGLAKGDILLFVHDDAEFLEDGWDCKLIEAMQDSEIVGVVGTDKYIGGKLFSSGFPHIIGKYVTTMDGHKVVKIGSDSKRTKVKAVDHFFMAVSRSYFQKEKFDVAFDGLFFSDIDYCLRSDKVYVADILMGHYKPEDLRGKYPEDMKPIEHFSKAFHEKHGLNQNVPDNPQNCAMVDMQTYSDMGQDKIFTEYSKKFKCKS